MVVGLGNPGLEYAGTRHNVGADVVALLADRHGGRLKAGKERSLSGEVRMGPHRVALAFPQTFYNDSGVAVAALLHRHGVDDPHRLVVVHDEMDLPAGKLKVKVGGGLAGNNGFTPDQERALLAAYDGTPPRCGALAGLSGDEMRLAAARDAVVDGVGTDLGP